MRLFLASLVLHNFFMTATPAQAGQERRISRGPAQVMSPTNTLETRSVNEIKNLFSKTMTAKDLLKKIDNKIPTHTQQFLMQKSSPVSNETFTIEKFGSNEFLVKTDSMLALVAVEDLEQGRFQINRKSVQIDIKAPADQIWRTLSQQLNIKEKVTLFEALFLEQAQAMNFMGLLLGVAIIGVIAYMYNQSNCSQYESYASQCDLAQANPGAVDGSNLYYQARTFDSSWTNLSMGCSDAKEKVRSCIPALSNRLNSNSSTTAVVQ